LAGAASKAELELSRKPGPTRAELSAASSVQDIIKACVAFERALAPPVHMPSADTLATIARVEAVRARLPSDSTLAAIASVEASLPKG
jgi:hypothetical protein